MSDVDLDEKISNSKQFKKLTRITKKLTLSEFDAKSYMNGYGRKATMATYNFDVESMLENNCKAAIFVLTKPQRTLAENQILVSYLKDLKPLIIMINEAVSEKNQEELMKNISYVLKYLHAQTNKILFKTGEKGDKFFIILKGKVGIVMPKDETVHLTKEEYFIYLLKLRKFREIELLNTCIFKNRNVFQIDNENFDEWVRSVQEYKNSPKSLNKIQSTVKKVITGAKLSVGIFNNIGKKLITSERKSSIFKVKLNRELQEALEVIKSEDENLVNEEDEIASISDYINRIKPDIKTDSIKERKAVSIWSYNHIITLSDGDKFGDFALDSHNQKRSGTVIAIENTHFGTMDKKSYENCIKNVNEKVKKAHMNFILSLPIFKDVNKHLFMKKYYNFIVHKKVSWKEKIIKEGDDPENIYIIKEGEFDINMKKSVSDMNNIIKYFRNGDESHITESEKEQLKFIESPDYLKFVNEKKFTKLSLINTSEVVGLNDGIIKDKFLYNVECVSAKGEVFEIKTKIFQMLCDVDQPTKKTVKIYEDKKINNLIQRILALKKAKLGFYKFFKIGQHEKVILNESKTKKKNEVEPTFATSINSFNKYSSMIKTTNKLTSMNNSLQKDKNKMLATTINDFETENNLGDNILIKENNKIINHERKTNLFSINTSKNYFKNDNIANKTSKSIIFPSFYQINSTNGIIQKLNLSNSASMSNVKFKKAKNNTQTIKSNIFVQNNNLSKEETKLFSNPYLKTTESNFKSPPIPTNSIENKTNPKFFLNHLDSYTNTIENNYLKTDDLNLYQELEKYSKLNNKTENKLKRTVFDKVFHHYLNNNENINENKNENLISPTKTQSSILNLNQTKNNLSHEKNYECSNANFVDCLVMDNFNRIYNTVYYYSNTFSSTKAKSHTHKFFLKNFDKKIKVKNKQIPILKSSEFLKKITPTNNMRVTKTLAKL